MAARVGYVLLLLGVLLSLGNCGGATSGHKIEVGERAPEFSLVGLDGSRRSLSSYRGQPLVLNFWATWCQPCHDEIPDLKKLADSGQIRVLSVAIDKEGEEIVRPFVDEWEIGYPVLIDDRKIFSAAYSGTTIPYTFVLDAEHIIRQIYRSPVTEEKVLTDLSRLSSGVGSIGS